MIQKEKGYVHMLACNICQAFDQLKHVWIATCMTGDIQLRACISFQLLVLFCFLYQQLVHKHYVGFQLGKFFCELFVYNTQCYLTLQKYF